MRYRRADVAGGTYFFTVDLAQRKRTLLVEHVDGELKETRLFRVAIRMSRRQAERSTDFSNC